MKNPKSVFSPNNAHVLMVSFLLGGTGTILSGIQGAIRLAEDALRTDLKVVVFVQPSVSEEESRKWADSLRTQDPEIQSAEYISKADALARAQANPALSKSLLLLRENPLPSSVLLQYSDVAWLERPEPGVTLRSFPEVQEIRWDPKARTEFRSLRQWNLWVTRITAFAFMMVFVWSFFGIYRFLALKARTGALLIQIGIGCVGGSLALATFQMALRSLGADAAAYRPDIMTPWPLVAAMMAAMATFGWKVPDEE